MATLTGHIADGREHSTDWTCCALDNIRAAVDRADGTAQADGLAWYRDAHDVAAAIAEASGLTLESAAAIIAALSPRNRWTRNIADALNVATSPDNHERCGTFGSNVATAERIARTNDPGYLSGRKVTSFWRNIVDPDSDHVTVDTWAIRAATGGAVSTVASDAQYAVIADAYRAAARWYGWRPSAVQAVAWVVVRDERLGQR